MSQRTARRSRLEYDIPLSETATQVGSAIPVLVWLYAPNAFAAQRVCDQFGFLDEEEDPEFTEELKAHLKGARAEELLKNIGQTDPDEKAFSLMVIAKAQEITAKQMKEKKEKQQGVPTANNLTRAVV